jgi:hypothetical protein
VPPHAPFVLVLHGDGFTAGSKVLIESGEAGRFVAFQPAELSATRGTVDLRVGFGPRPAVRRVLVESLDGERSPALALRIAAAPAAPAAGGEATPGSAPPAPEATRPDDARDAHEAAPAPRLTEVLPAPLPAGRPVVLQVHGAGFADGARVWILANRHAGTARLPEYELVAFTAELVDPELLEVTLDRGFYPVPSPRDVVVENPDGRRSRVLLLDVRAEDG